MHSYITEPGIAFIKVSRLSTQKQNKNALRNMADVDKLDAQPNSLQNTRSGSFACHGTSQHWTNVIV